MEKAKREGEREMEKKVARFCLFWFLMTNLEVKMKKDIRKLV